MQESFLPFSCMFYMSDHYYCAGLCLTTITWVGCVMRCLKSVALRETRQDKLAHNQFTPPSLSPIRSCKIWEGGTEIKADAAYCCLSMVVDCHCRLSTL